MRQHQRRRGAGRFLPQAGERPSGRPDLKLTRLHAPIIADSDDAPGVCQNFELHMTH
jgi:hypothetical protein